MKHAKNETNLAFGFGALGFFFGGSSVALVPLSAALPSEGSDFATAGGSASGDETELEADRGTRDSRLAARSAAIEGSTPSDMLISSSDKNPFVEVRSQ